MKQYKYIKTAVELIMLDYDRIYNMIGLYKEIAEIHGCDYRAVEKGIRKFKRNKTYTNREYILLLYYRTKYLRDSML